MYRNFKEYNRYKRELVLNPILFFFLIVIFAIACGIVAYDNSNKVLGTELNANGEVEYLCLGTACEDLPPMKWNDKE
jgi:hypothetical protein